MQVQVPVISNEQCKKLYSKLAGYEVDPSFDDRVLCTGGSKKGGKDSCQGDSGGPVMLPIHQNGAFPFYQIGIVSHSEGCAQPNVPGVNTNIQKFADWVNKKMAMTVEGFKA